MDRRLSSTTPLLFSLLLCCQHSPTCPEGQIDRDNECKKPDDGTTAASTGGSRERPAKLNAMVEAALRAIRSNNADDYLKLQLTLDRLVAACPHLLEKIGRERIQRRMAETRRKTRMLVAECHRNIRWSLAKRTGVRGGEHKAVGDLQKCRAKVQALTNIVVTYDVAGTSYQVKLYDPYIVDGEYGIVRYPMCRKLPRKP